MQTTDPKFQLRYLVMPDYIYQDNRLNAVAIKIYCFINTYRNPFYFTNDQLAEMFDTSVRTIENSISQLKELEYIAVKHKTKGGGGKTRLIRTTEFGGSEPPSDVVRQEKDEATNHQKGGNNDIKDNTLKGEGNYRTIIRREDRKPVIGGWGKPQPRESRPLKEYPKRGGVARGEDII